MTDRWIRSYTNGIEYIDHLDGVDWFDAPPPPRRHRCTPQTRGWMSGGYVERCACGAVRLDRRSLWMERNQRAVPESRLGWLRRLVTRH